MKKLLLFLALALMPGMILFSQSPQAFKYQAIARDDAGNVLSVWDLSLRISLLEEGTDGRVVYTETHKVQTNIFGLINLVIGDGDIVDGDFSSIKWGENRHYIKIEMDIEGGEDYKDVGFSQLYAVPYAQYAEEAGQLKQPEPSYKTSEITGTVKSPQPGSGPRGTPNSKISATEDGWLNALTGNVGIGTTSPSQLLSVYGGEFLLKTDDNLEDQSILFQNAGGRYTWRIYRTDAGSNNANLRIAGGGNNDHTALSDFMTFKHNGNVGIGTTAPAGILDIAGAYHFPGTDGTSGQVLQTDGTGTISWEDQIDSTDIAGMGYVTGGNYYSCIDYDGNAYPTFQIGPQVWMAENLRVTHYSNGDPIPNVTDDGTWSGLTSGAYCWYDNNQSANEKYGTIYNWYTVDDSRGLCPDGWHVPTHDEWTTLTTYFRRGICSRRENEIQ